MRLPQPPPAPPRLKKLKFIAVPRGLLQNQTSRSRGGSGWQKLEKPTLNKLAFPALLAFARRLLSIFQLALSSSVRSTGLLSQQA
jgi:hypothetical protein